MLTESGCRHTGITTGAAGEQRSGRKNQHRKPGGARARAAAAHSTPPVITVHSRFMIQLSNIVKSYRQGATVVDVLRGVNLEVADGASVAIVGASGSGKSTLLSVMACMDRPYAGRLVLNGRDATALTESELAQLRNRQLAIVFQSF